MVYKCLFFHYKTKVKRVFGAIPYHRKYKDSAYQMIFIKFQVLKM